MIFNFAIKMIYTYFDIISLIQYKIKKNYILNNCLLYINEYYNGIKNKIYQCREEPTEDIINIDGWCCTTSIYEPNYNKTELRWKNVKLLLPLFVEVLLNKMSYFTIPEYYFDKEKYFTIIPLIILNVSEVIPILFYLIRIINIGYGLYEYLYGKLNIKIQYNDKYYMLFNDNCSISDKSNTYLSNDKYIIMLSDIQCKILSSIVIIMKTHTNINNICSLDNYLLTMKNNKCYYTKIINKRHNITNLFPYNYIISNVKFVTIEYCHPSLKTPIQINLSNKYYAVGSEILDPNFIYRYFMHLYGNWINNFFDTINYKLSIIDENFNMIILKPTQYITLGENNFQVCDFNLQ